MKDRKAAFHLSAPPPFSFLTQKTSNPYGWRFFALWEKENGALVRLLPNQSCVHSSKVRKEVYFLPDFFVMSTSAPGLSGFFKRDNGSLTIPAHRHYASLSERDGVFKIVVK
jgi:hypothetical protein